MLETIITENPIGSIPVNTGYRTTVGLVLVQRRRRWANTKPTMVQCPVLTGMQITRNFGGNHLETGMALRPLEIKGT